MSNSGKAKENLKRFFEILDIKEESMAGTIWSPVFISSYRVALTAELDKILKELKEFATEEEETDNQKLIRDWSSKSDP